MLAKQAQTLQTVKKTQKHFWQMPTHSSPFMATSTAAASMATTPPSSSPSLSASSPHLASASLYLVVWCSVQSSWYLSVFFSKQPLLHTLNKLDCSYLPGSLRRETNLPNAIWQNHTSHCTLFFSFLSG